MQLFKVTFIDEAGHVHRGTVPADSLRSVVSNLSQQYGDPVRLACIRLPMRPDVRFPPPEAKWGSLCES